MADRIVLHQVRAVAERHRGRGDDPDARSTTAQSVLARRFHAATAMLTAMGLILRYAPGPDRRSPAPMRTLVELARVGRGAFHVVDQVLFEVLVDLHHIPEGVGSRKLGKWSFFVASLALAAAGCLLLRRGGSNAALVTGA